MAIFDDYLVGGGDLIIIQGGRLLPKLWKSSFSLTKMTFSSLSVQNENLRPFLNKNIPIISRKYGLAESEDETSVTDLLLLKKTSLTRGPN